MAKSTTVFKPINIKIPQFTHKKERDQLDPYFQVLDVPLKGDFSGFTDLKFTPKEAFGDRIFINANTGDIVGRGSKSYKLFTHSQASEVVFGFLDKIGLKYQALPAQVSNNGSRFFQTIVFPGLAFDPASDLKIDSTALDSPGALKDKFFPAFTWKNSYDRTSPVSFGNGLYRVWCENGSSLPVVGRDVSLSFRHTEIVNAQKVHDLLIERLEESTRLGTVLYSRLNQENGTQFLQGVLNSSFSDKFKRLVLDKLVDNADIALDVKTDDKGRVNEWVVKDAKTAKTAYAIYNVVTDVSTHQLTNRYEREQTDRKIAKVFVEPVLEDA